MTETNGHDYGELLVIQHAAHSGPSALTEVLDARAGRRPWRLVDVSRGAAYPSLDRVRGAVVLGGAMGVHDVAEHPWLEYELEILHTASRAGIPLFGICLGAQLLGMVFAGEVAPRKSPEIAFVPLTRTQAGEKDPVFAGWPDGAAALFIHDDEVTRLPPGAVEMLEGSEGSAAWRAPDGSSYAVQFHPEVEAAQVAAWCRREDKQQRFAAAGVDPAVLATEASRRNRFLRAVGLSLVGRWIDVVVGRDDPDPQRGRRARTVG
ncbi:MAG: type 1 glutamine amidotransferase [Actinomycetota bacterium]|nr:type 1 glutamine amidotransferase [Actinomycetota bacterium]